MDTLQVVRDPYKDCTFMTTSGLVFIEESKETEPDGFGGFLYDIKVRYLRGGRIEWFRNMSASMLENGLNRAEIDAWEVYERGLEDQHNRKGKVVTCPKCGPLTRGHDKHARARILADHNQLRHSDS